MNERTQGRDEISLTDLLKALLKKWKVLLITLLCGVIVGAGYGAFSTAGVEYYGTKIDFYVNPRLDKNSSAENNSQYGVYGAYGLHIMDNMITLLGSELFAERLTLDKDGLPEEQPGNTTLNAKIAAAKDAKLAQEAATEDIEDKEAEIEALNVLLITLRNNQSSALNAQTAAEKAATSAYDRMYTAWLKQPVSKVVGGETVQKPGRPELGYGDGEMDALITNSRTCDATFEDAVQAYTAATATLSAKELELSMAKVALTELKKVSVEVDDAEDDAREAAIIEWRKTAKYASMMKLLTSSVKYSYYNEGEDQDVKDLALSFIYVRISVLKNKDFAEWLYDKVTETIPLFVEENMAVPSGYDGTNCRRITRNDEIRRTNEGYTMKTAIKYGMLLGAVAFVIACVVVILVDRSDKRLRDYEQTMEQLGVPVLGVIPAMTNNKSDKENAK